MSRRRTTASRAARRPGGTLVALPGAAAAARTRERARLDVAALRRTIDPAVLPGPRAWSRHRTHIIGQDRAIEALELGLRLDAPGYNVFLAGPSGSGRMSTARHILAGFREPRRPLRDFVYVHNFHEPDRARLLTLEPGEGQRLRKAMERLVAGVRHKLPRALGLEACQQERDRLVAEYEKREREIVAAFQRQVRERGFAMVGVSEEAGTDQDILPVLEGKPHSLAELQEAVSRGKLSSRRMKQLERAREGLRGERDQAHRKLRLLARELATLLEEFDQRVGSAVIDNLIEEVREEFSAADVVAYLEEVAEALRERIPALVRRENERANGPASASGSPDGGGVEPVAADLLAPFQVNVVLSSARRHGCPLVFEHTPSVVRLFGTIERSQDDDGTGDGGFMHIRIGALLRADGGFLVLNAEDVLTEPGAWTALKRTLATGHLDVRAPEGGAAGAPTGLKPDPIPIHVKIVMLGDEEVYRFLYLQEDDFKKMFKVKAEFDVEMAFDRANLEKFLAFLDRVVTQEKLPAPDARAVAALVEEAMRDVEAQHKISTRFRVTADLLREAGYWARAAGARRMSRAHVERALRERYRRIDLADEKYREEIERQVIMVETSGRRVGQVNGLTVFDLGDYSFGKPCRITGSVGMGRAGIINIEREAGLSGETHDKGVYILTGFLRNRFGRKVPLALEASVCLEQSYGPIDGDSASSTEVYAILSCLADAPLDQGIAVTGSVSQHGDVQPIGGVNQKIEGFFEICQARGLDGAQGVMIPRGNRDHLMLRLEVIEAVRAGRFHIWAVSTIDEGMEILTGVSAGAPGPDGEYPPGTLNARVLARLREMAAEMRRFPA